MPNFSWNGATGGWGDPSQWTPAGVPATTADTATIVAAGPYIVTIADATAFAPGGITLGNAEAVLAVDGTLTLGGGTIALNAGTLALGAGGSVGGAVLHLQGGSFVSTGGTVTGATFRGPLVFGDTMALAVGGTLTLLDAAGAAPGAIDMSGFGGTLQIQNSLTLDAATLNVSGPSSLIVVDPAATLTLGAGLAATFSANPADIWGNLVNAGSLAVTGGTTLVQHGTLFENDGRIRIENGELLVGNAGFANAGSLDIAAGGRLLVGAGVSIANSGTLSLDAGGTLALDGSYTPAQLAAIGVVANGGTLEVAGTLDLGGGTLTLAGSGLFSAVALSSGGTISNGTILPAGGTLVAAGGTLDGVTWLGDLGLGDSAALAASGGLTLSNGGAAQLSLGTAAQLQVAGELAMGSGGSIAMGSELATLGFLGDTVLDGVTASLSGANTSIQIDGGTLTLGGATFVDLSGDGTGLNGTIVNQGQIVLTAGSATIRDVFDPSSFTNQGTISLAGARLVINDTSFTNAGLIDIADGGVVSIDTLDRFVNPGTIVVGTGGTLELLDSMTLADLVSGNLEGAGGTLVIGGPLDLQTGTMDIELTPAGSVIDLIAGGTIQNGTIHVSGGPFLTSGGTLESIIHEGSLTVTSFGSLAAQGGLTVTGLDGTGPGAVVLNDGAVLSLRDGLAMGGGTIAMTGSLSGLSFDQDNTLAGLTVALSGGSAEIDVTAGTLALGSTAVLAATATFGTAFGNLLNQGRISVTIGDFTVDDWNPGDGFRNEGVLDVAGGRFTVASDLFANAGTVTIGADGIFAIDASSSFASTGAISIGASGTLDIGGATAADVGFSGTGLLVLDDAGGYTGTIGGLSIGTAIQLTGQTVLSASITGTTLTALFDGGGSVAYTVDPALPGLTVGIETGGDGQQDLLRILCFRAGTRLETASGLREVETLRAGDLVRTAAGALRPIRWIGHRDVDCRRHPDPAAVRPVRIAAGAFGPAQPARALYLSPDHAIHADGVLVPVRHLVNGSTIRQVRVTRAAYFHVELDRHDILLAEGLEAESYLDTGDRDCFDDSPVLRLHPVFGRDVTLAREALACAPILVAGPVVDRLRARLARPRRRAA